MKLAKDKVLSKFLEMFRLKLVEVPQRSGMACYLCKDSGAFLYTPINPSMISSERVYPIYVVNNPQTCILDRLFDSISWWTESGSQPKSREVNPLFGCKTLEEAMLKLDLLDSEKV